MAMLPRDTMCCSLRSSLCGMVATQCLLLFTTCHLTQLQRQFPQSFADHAGSAITRFTLFAACDKVAETCHFLLLGFEDFNSYMREKTKNFMIRLNRYPLTFLYTTITYHNTMKPNIPVLDWMLISSSLFVHLQNKQKQTFASDQLAINHVTTTADNIVRIAK